MNIKKYLDGSGLTHLWTRIEENYPTNEDLTNVVNAIDETKADKADIVQSDWNQNDPEAKDYVKNRTHWSKSAFTTLIEEQSVTTVAHDNDDFDCAYAAISGSLYPTIGQTYEIVFNGATYECVAYGLPDWGSAIFIGNGSIIGANGGNEEPFCIETYGYGELSLDTVDAGTYTISISSNIEEIHKIDSKYLDLNIVSGFSEGSLRTKYSAGGNYGYVMGEYAFAEGYQTQATGPASHAEGMGTEASGAYSHAEGLWTHARNEAAHAEGRATSAEGLYSHAEGRDATAKGNYSHVEGLGTQALSGVQHVQGRRNIPDSEDKYLHIVGNGSSQYDQSNAHTLDWDGNAWFAGDVYVSSTSGVNKDEGSQKLATEGYVNSSIDNALAEVSSDTIVEQNKNKDIKFWVGTEEELDLIETRDENCLYFTTDSEAGNVSSAARCTTVTLNANNWTLNANNIYVQEVQASGVLADENAQLITISPYGNGFDNHLLAAEVFCIEQKENALVFRAINDAPDGNVQLLIVLEDINWINQ